MRFRRSINLGFSVLPDCRGTAILAARCHISGLDVPCSSFNARVVFLEAGVRSFSANLICRAPFFSSGTLGLKRDCDCDCNFDFDSVYMSAILNGRGYFIQIFRVDSGVLGAP
jgi:hypothetical protein